MLYGVAIAGGAGGGLRALQRVGAITKVVTRAALENNSCSEQIVLTGT